MKQPLVAIVTPTYNGAAYLAETMASVQAQTYPNLLHVVLDNASTDATSEIIDRFRDGRVRVAAYRNATVLRQRDNWNTAFGHVPDEAVYVRLLCDDDTISPDSIAKMVALAESDPDIGIVGCLHECLGGITDFKWPETHAVIEGREAIRRSLTDQGTIMPIHLLMRKSLADAREPLFDDYMDSSFDIDTTYDLLRQSKFGFVHEPLGFTRVHEGAVSNQLYATNAAWTRDALMLLLKYGRFAFGDDYPRELRRFRRYYMRRIVQWRRSGMPGDSLAIHHEALKRANWSFSPALLGDAVLNWIAIKLGLDRPWRGYPGWQ